jgi:hypothetical protein
MESAVNGQNGWTITKITMKTIKIAGTSFQMP